MKEFKENNLKECLDYQLKLNWYNETFEDLVADKDWLDKYECTEETEKEFIKYLRNYLKDFTFKQRREKEISWFILQYWFKYKV